MAYRAIAVAVVACGLVAGALACSDGATSADPAKVQAHRQYIDAMNAWFKTYRTDIQDEAAGLTFEDPMTPTGAELERVRQFALIEYASLADLQKIVPPEPIAKAHAKFCEAQRQTIEAMDLWASILESRDWSQMELCHQMNEDAHNLELEALKLLEPYIDDPNPTSP